MGILKKSIKAYLIAASVFIILTFIVALMIRYTSFKEEWSFTGVIVCMAAASLFLGFMEGKIVGKKGLMTGLLSSVIFVLIILVSIGCTFAEFFNPEHFNLTYAIPVVAGIAGSIMGTNSSK